MHIYIAEISKIVDKKYFRYFILAHDLVNIYLFILTISTIISFSNDLQTRFELYTKLCNQGIPFTNVIDPTVIINSNVSIGTGNVIIANCRIGACAVIGNNNFLSTYTNLEHHNILGNHCTFGPGVFTSSRVRIGDRVKFGTGIFIEPGVSIGSESIISSGSVLVKNVDERTIVKKLNDLIFQKIEKN